MGTNYYLTTTNKDLAHDKFGWNYQYREDPELCYAIHLNKCSFGWRPLFQRHEQFQSFNELLDFIESCGDGMKIYDEYGRKYTVDEYKDMMVNHADRELMPEKWVYSVTDFDKKYSKNPKPSLHTEECEPEEADLWIPFIHDEYARTEREARRKYKLYPEADFSVMNYSRDPDYPFDWVDGEFS